ncbi:MAG: type II toxin-antitoxin system HicB family antitoxin [bacterium]
MSEEKRVFTAVVFPDDEQYAALCLELDVAACGTTPQEAVEALRELIGEYLECASEEGIDYRRPVPLEALREIASRLPVLAAPTSALERASGILTQISLSPPVRA